MDETLPAIPYAQPEVAAASFRGGQRGGRGRGNQRGRGQRGGRGNRGGGGGGTQPQTRQYKGTKHPDLPAGNWTGARCISDTAANVTSAQSPSLVLGRTSSPPSLQTIVQTIETGTSLAPPTINSISHNYILLCIKTISRKYIA